MEVWNWITFILIIYNYYIELFYYIAIQKLENKQLCHYSRNIHIKYCLGQWGAENHCRLASSCGIAKIMLTAFKQHTCEWTPGPSSLSPPVVLSETPGHTHFWVCLQCYSFLYKSLLEWHWTHRTFLQGPGCLQQSGVEFVQGGQEQAAAVWSRAPAQCRSLPETAGTEAHLKDSCRRQWLMWPHIK